MRAPARQHGISMIEVLITLGIIAVLAGVMMPGMSSMIASQGMKNGASDLYSTLLRARSEAIKRNADITVRPATGGWAAGWTIANPNDSTKPLESHGALPNAVVTGPSSVVYTGSGRLRAATSPEFDFSAPNTANERCLSIDLSGRPNMQRTGC